MMLTPLKPHPSHNMLKMQFGDPYRLKCEHCGLTDLQDDVERACRPRSASAAKPAKAKARNV